MTVAELIAELQKMPGDEEITPGDVSRIITLARNAGVREWAAAGRSVQEIAEHFGLTERHAKTLGRIPARRVAYRWRTEDGGWNVAGLDRIVALRDGGATYRAVGAVFGLSASLAQQLYAKAMRLWKAGRIPTPNASPPPTA